MSLDVFEEERESGDKCISGIRVVVWVGRLRLMRALDGWTWCPLNNMLLTEIKGGGGVDTLLTSRRDYKSYE
jgi:hypothetical protein